MVQKMPSKSTITIGLPIHNSAKYLRQCIESILTQTYCDFKLIIIDDGSSDNSVEIVNSFNDHRITLISDGKNIGLPARLNQIILMTESKYLARMDSDDIMHPRRLEFQINFLEENVNIDVLGSNAFVINDKSEVVGLRYEYKELALINNVVSFIHPTIIGKTAWFRSNLYDINFKRLEDFELWHRTRNNSNFAIINLPLLFYREVPGNYYKKYFSANLNCISFLSKYKLNISLIIFFAKNILIGLTYFLFNLFDKESFLLNKRNVFLYKKAIDYKFYFKFEFDKLTEIN